MKVAAIALIVLVGGAAGCSSRMVGLEPLPPERPDPAPRNLALRWKPLPVDSVAPGFAVEDVRYDLRVFEG